MSVENWDPNGDEDDDETYYAEVKVQNLKEDVFKVQDMEEVAELESDVKLGRSSALVCVCALIILLS